MLPRQQQPQNNLLHKLQRLRSQHNYPRPTVRSGTHSPSTLPKPPSQFTNTIPGLPTHHSPRHNDSHVLLCIANLHQNDNLDFAFRVHDYCSAED
jgi:hypothetical protein